MADEDNAGELGGASAEVALKAQDEEAVLGEIIDELPPRRRAQLIEIVERWHAGPLPDPASFAGYEAALPGTGQELVDAARQYRQHNIHMDCKLANTARLSLCLTFVAVLGAIALAGWCIDNGQPVLAAIFGVAGLSPVFVGMIKGGGRWSGR